MRAQHDQAAIEARLGALENRHLQDIRALNMLADCLQRELQTKSELLEKIRQSTQQSLVEAGRDASGANTHSGTPVLSHGTERNSSPEQISGIRKPGI